MRTTPPNGPSPASRLYNGWTRKGRADKGTPRILPRMTIRSVNMPAAGQQSPFDAEFDQLVHKILEEWKIPGLSIAVVHGSHTHPKVW